MGTGAIVAVIVVVAILLIVGYFGTQFFFKVVEVRQENTFCENWFNNLEQRRAEAESSFWKELSFDHDQYNAEVADYNRQCYY